MITVPVEVLDAAGLDAEMRAIAEMAASGSEQRAALPPVEMDPAERAMEEQPQVEAADVWIEELPDVPAPGGGGTVTGDLGCFRIVHGPIEEPDEGEEVSPTIHFGNRYLQYGNLTLSCDDVEITDADYPTPEPGQDPELVVAIKATTTAYQSAPTISIVTYDSISEMQEDQHKLDYVIIPLYLLGENFSVQCDFRKQPMAPVGEVM